LRFTYIKKLSPGLTEESIPVISVTFLSGAVVHAASENNAEKRMSDFFINSFIIQTK
jgi:hypothetical protein